MTGSVQNHTAVGRRAWVAAIGVIATVALLGPGAGAAWAAVAMGIHAERGGDDFLSEAELLRMRQGGATEIRVPFEWELVQKDPDGPLDFGKFDKLVRWASEGTLPRIRILPILIGSPPFVEQSAANGEPPVTEADLERWRVFVTSAVARYGRAGTFWTETSGVQFNPITDWQVWNEPNLRMFWTDGSPSAKEYAAFLDFTNRTIKSAEPTARTVLAGMPEREDAPKSMAAFLTKLYKVKGFRRDFDVLAIHPYVPLDDRRGLENAVTLIRGVARRNGDRKKPIYLTEVGAASAGPTSPFTTNEKGQRKALLRIFGGIQEFGRDLGVKKAYWYSWRDSDDVPPAFPQNNRWQTYAGLFRKHGAPKSAWGAFAKLAGGDPGADSLP